MEYVHTRGNEMEVRMITLRVNVIALFVAGFLAWSFAVALNGLTGVSYKDLAVIAVGVFSVVRSYDYISGMNAFKGGNKGRKDGGK